MVVIALCGPGTGMTACGKNPHDLYIQALEAQGRAERGACQLVYDKDSNAHLINSDRILRCLQEVREAKGLYVEAQATGMHGKEVDRSITKIDADIARLEEMLRMVQQMELDSRLDRGGVHRPGD